MRKTRIGKQIYVQGVPLDTIRFCPYCCATVDTAFVTLGATGSRTRTSAGLTRLLVIPALHYPSEEYVSGRSHKVRRAGSNFSLTIVAS
jgi:hypothetical protein